MQLTDSEFLKKVKETIDTPSKWIRGQLCNPEGNRFCVLGAGLVVNGINIISGEDRSVTERQLIHDSNERVNNLLAPVARECSEAKLKKIEHYNDGIFCHSELMKVIDIAIERALAREEEFDVSSVEIEEREFVLA